ncbi:MAG: hypothetical protein KDK39_19750, partial [Leptospiraceae bacterium]|nr:hypothetical protein [Leptospiraceae bacterium]
MILDEYVANEKAIYDNELGQRVQIQMKEWELRERALHERYDAWNKRMQTILERGTKSWAASEQEFTFKWREWRKEQDQEETEARELWQQRTKDHFAAKAEWQKNIQQQYANGSIENELGSVIDQLNNQIRQAESSYGIELEGINRTEAINKAMDDVLLTLPSHNDQLAEMNKSIQSFSTALSLSELTAVGNGLFVKDDKGNSLGGQFRDEM